MGLVDDDCEGPSPVLVADLVKDKRELLHGTDDDLLAVLNEFPKITGVLGVSHSRGNLHEALDGVLYLVVEDAPVGYHDDRVEQVLTCQAQSCQLMGQPRDGIGLAATGRMLDQVPLSHPVL